MAWAVVAGLSVVSAQDQLPLTGGFAYRVQRLPPVEPAAYYVARHEPVVRPATVPDTVVIDPALPPTEIELLPLGDPCGGCGNSGCTGCDGGCGPSDCGGCGCDDDCCSCVPEERCLMWYGSLSGAWCSRETVHEVGDANTFIVFDGGFAANAAVGREFDIFRVEAEFSYMNQNVRTAGAGIPNVGNSVSGAEGNVGLRAYMFNIYHDVQLDGWRLKPYVGAGLGFYQSEINALQPEFFAGLGLPTAGVNATSNLPFAWQVRAGTSYELTDRTDVFLGYRYFHGEELTFAAEPFGVFHPNGAVTHSLELGFRVRF
jgi:opacity protein-like surface antigen